MKATARTTRGRVYQLALVSVVGVALALIAAPAAAGPGDPPDGPRYDHLGRPIEPDAKPPPPTKVHPPEPLNYSAPVYPEKAQVAGIEGEVILALDIDTTGKVTRVEVVKGGEHGFGEAAAAAAWKIKFTPARKTDGTAIAARIPYRYRFVLQPAVPDKPDTKPDPVLPQQGILSGTLLIQEAEEPLVGASIKLVAPDGTEQLATSDPQGQFRFVDLPSGNYRVEVAAAGYSGVQLEELIVKGEETVVTYRLEAKTVGGAIEIVVEGKRPAREVTRRTIEKREIERIPGTMGDALRSVENLPGVARPFAGIAGVLLVRGSGPADTQTFVDGVYIPLIYHFGGLSSVVPTELLSKIDFYPGNFSARYGRVMGGIVDAGIRSPRSDGYHGLAQLDLIDARLMLEGPVPGLEGWTFAAAARRSWFDVWLAEVLDALESSTTTAPRYWDYQFMLENKPNDDERLRMSFYGSDDLLRVLVEGAGNPLLSGDIGFSTVFQRFQTEYDYKLDNGDEVRAVIAFGREDFEIGVSQFFLLLEAFSLLTRAEYTHKLSSQARLHVGLDVLAGVWDLAVRFPALPAPGQPANQPWLTRTVEQSAERGISFQPAVYAEFSLTPDSRTRIVPGVRLDYDLDSESFDVSPRLNARYKIVEEFPTTTIKGGIGMFHQPPAYQQVNEPFGSPGAKSNRAIHYGLGLEQEITKQFEVSGEGFFKQLDNLVVGQVSQSSSAVEYKNTGQGYVVGAEILAKYKPDSRFFGWVAYTLSRSIRQDNADSEEYLVSWDQTHILTMLGSYRLGGGWEIGARFRLVTGNLNSPRVCNAVDEDCDPNRINALYNAATGRYSSLAFGERNNERLPMFHQLDLRVDKKWDFGLWQLSGYLDIMNVYNQQNVEGIGYNFNFTARQYSAGIPFLPSIGLRGEM